MPVSSTPLILASGSETRRQMLFRAGLTFRVVPADVDERAIQRAVQEEDPEADGSEIAMRLAAAKAEAVSAKFPEALVIGADQVLTYDGKVFEKPADIEGARRQLSELRGRQHQLHSAIALARGGEALWEGVDVAVLSMRRFTDAFLDTYLEEVGDKVCTSVGAYQLEGLGIQLFESIDGDYFTILGLPLLMLLDVLREEGIVRK